MDNEESGSTRLLVPLFAIQFLSWSGMFCLWIYAVPVITQFVLHTGSSAVQYSRGLIVVSLCFASYALLATTLAFALPALLKHLRAGTIYGAGLLIGAAGLTSLGLIQRPLLLIPAFIAISVGWSAMSNIPYALASAAAGEGKGAHIMRLFGFSTVIPQVATTLLLAVAARPMFGEALNGVMLAGGAMMATGGLIALAMRHWFDMPTESW